MTKSKNSKRALLASLLSMFVCIAMLIGSTFAWFTDTATTSVNSIQSGTLAIDLVNEAGESIKDKTLEFKNADGETDILWEPGATYKLDNFKIVNKGNLALAYKVTIEGIDGSDALLKVIDFTLKEGTADEKKLENWEGTLLPKKETELITIKGHMQESAGNEYQGQTLDTIKIKVDATQTPYEKDSTDEKYDKKAAGIFVEANYEAKNPSELKSDISKVKPGESIAVRDDIEVDQSSLSFTNQKDVTVNLAGNALERSTGSGNGIVIKNDADVTFENGSIVSTKGGNVFRIEAGSPTITFKDCDFICEREGSTGNTFISNYNNVDGSKVTMIFENCTFNTGFITLGGEEVDLQFNNCEFNWNDKNGSHFVDLSGNTYGSVALDGCSFNFTNWWSGGLVNFNSIPADKTLDVSLNDITVTATGDSSKRQNKPNVVNATFSSYAKQVTLNSTGTNKYTFNGSEVNWNTIVKSW